jgi:hypothetical protein
VLHSCYSALTPGVPYYNIKTLIPDRQSPTTCLSFKTHIAESREEVIKESEAMTKEIQIYCDGSGYKGNTGAAAILF